MCGAYREWTRVVVSMRVTRAEGYDEPRDSVSHDLVRWLAGIRMVPLLVPNALSDPEAFLDAVGAEAILLSGGNDLSPEAYHRGGVLGDVGPPRGGIGAPTADMAPARDRTERRLLSVAVERRLPTFGICRGMQMMNAFFGGSLRRLENARAHIATTHPVWPARESREQATDSRAQVLLGERTAANSYHGYGIEIEDLAQALRPLAFARDGTVEALFHPELPMAAVMWHPERPGPSRDADACLLRHLFRDTARWLAIVGERAPEQAGGTP